MTLVAEVIRVDVQAPLQTAYTPAAVLTALIETGPGRERHRAPSAGAFIDEHPSAERFIVTDRATRSTSVIAEVPTVGCSCGDPGCRSFPTSTLGLWRKANSEVPIRALRRRRGALLRTENRCRARADQSPPGLVLALRGGAKLHLATSGDRARFHGREGSQRGIAALCMAARLFVEEELNRRETLAT